MNTKILIFYIFLLSTESIISSDFLQRCFSYSNISQQDLSLKKSTDIKWSDPHIAPSCLPNPLTSKDRTRRRHKLVTAQVQALRNIAVIDYPALLANKKYKILEGFVYDQADELGIPHRKYNYLISFNSNKYRSATDKDINRDIAQCYGKYSDNPDALPKRIRNHRMYARYNQEQYDDSSSDDDSYYF